MEEIGKSLKTVFDKIADFFDIFDLSFFVAGIGTGSAFLYLYYVSNYEFDLPIQSAFFKVILIVMFFYIIGLVSFALGRFFRVDFFWRRSYREMDTRLRAAIHAHSLNNKEPFTTYLNLPQNMRGLWRLYVRLWAKLRDDSKLYNSYSQVRRFWVMSATYDGVFISLVTWIITLGYLVFIDKSFSEINYTWGSMIIGMLFFSAWGCKNEAQRNLLNQVDEIIAIAANSQDDWNLS